MGAPGLQEGVSSAFCTTGPAEDSTIDKPLLCLLQSLLVVL